MLLLNVYVTTKLNFSRAGYCNNIFNSNYYDLVLILTYKVVFSQPNQQINCLLILFSKRMMAIVYAFSILFHNLIMGLSIKGGIIMDQKPKSKNTNDHHGDSFHLFMFGDRGVKEKADIENDQQDLKSTEDHPDVENHLSREDWFLGKRKHNRGKENRQNEYSQIDELLNQVNMDELMNNIDDLFNSISHIKPLWKKMGPVLNKWMKH
jgi:hypothetical protein